MVVDLSSLLSDKCWRDLLTEELDKPYIQELEDFLGESSLAGKSILPPQPHWFEALNYTTPEEVKVVILGQDPYPTHGHAHGLCFSVRPEVKPLPKSLVNIYRELWDDCGIDNSHTGFLVPWAEQGVLLLNAVLTVEEGQSNAHKGRGWERFTDTVIEVINHHAQGVVFLLWGAQAQKKGEAIDRDRHLVLTAPHPSPLSAYRGFWGSKPFSKINDYLIQQGKAQIDWQL